MPKDPKGRKRPGDVIGNAVHVMRIATGEIDEPSPNPKFVARASKGGTGRARRLTPTERRRIAKRAAEARWRKS